MRHLLTIALLFICLTSYGQEINWHSSRQIGAGHIISLPATSDMVSFNPSVHYTGMGLGGQAAYTLPHGIEAFRQQFVHALWGSHLGYIGVSAGINGDDNSSFRRAGFQYSRNFGHGWRAGLAYYFVQHHFITKQNFNSSFSAAGISYHNTASGMTVSVAIQNFEQQTIAYPHHTFLLPSIAVLGIQWEASNNIFLLAEAEKDFDHRPIFKGAVVFHIGTLADISAGVSSPPLQLTAGAGVTYHGVKLHAALSHHRELGLTTAASLSIYGLFTKQSR